MARTPPLSTRSGGSLNRGRKRPCWRARCSRFSSAAGKTDGMLGEWASHADLHGKNAVGLMVRRERVQLLETIERSREIYAPLGARYNDQDKMWRWPNGARLRFAYLECDADADAYQGHSYTRVYVEELGTFPSASPVLRLMA